LEHAKTSFEQNDYKWSIIKSYYAVFHSTKAIIFLMGLKEKSHFGVGEILDWLCTQGKIENRYVIEFKAAQSAR